MLLIFILYYKTNFRSHFSVEIVFIIIVVLNEDEMFKIITCLNKI